MNLAKNHIYQLWVEADWKSNMLCLKGYDTKTNTELHETKLLNFLQNLHLWPTHCKVVFYYIPPPTHARTHIYTFGLYCIYYTTWSTFTNIIIRYFNLFHTHNERWARIAQSAVTMLQAGWLMKWGLIPCRGQDIFLFSIMSRLALRATQPPI
jgi:hypothetical protein